MHCFAELFKIYALKYAPLKQHPDLSDIVQEGISAYSQSLCGA